MDLNDFLAVDFQMNCKNVLFHDAVDEFWCSFRCTFCRSIFAQIIISISKILQDMITIRLPTNTKHSKYPRSPWIRHSPSKRQRPDVLSLIPYKIINFINCMPATPTTYVDNSISNNFAICGMGSQVADLTCLEIIRNV